MDTFIVASPPDKVEVDFFCGQAEFQSLAISEAEKLPCLLYATVDKGEVTGLGGQDQANFLIFRVAHPLYLDFILSNGMIGLYFCNSAVLYRCVISCQGREFFCRSA